MIIESVPSLLLTNSYLISALTMTHGPSRALHLVLADSEFLLRVLGFLLRFSLMPDVRSGGFRSAVMGMRCPRGC